MKKNPLVILVFAIMYLYGLSQVYFIPYYNWEFAKENGFIKWLLLGEVVATVKASIWPYFVFFQNSSNERISDLAHFDKSIEYSNEAAKITLKGKPLEGLDEGEKKSLIYLRKRLYRRLNW